MASEMMTKIYRGTRAKNGVIAIALTPATKVIIRKVDATISCVCVPNVYMVGAHAPDVLSAMRTSINFPKPPAGASTAMTSPPALFPLSNPVAHAGIPGAAAANAAPIICHDICRPRVITKVNIASMKRKDAARTLGTRNPKYVHKNMRRLSGDHH